MPVYKRQLTRRDFLIGAAAAAAIGVAGVGGFDITDHSQFERGLHRIGLLSSPDRRFPPSGAHERSGSFHSRYMHGPVGWTISYPAGNSPAAGVIVCLHGYHENHRFAFDQLQLPDAAAYVGLHVGIAGVDGGADSYWHKRADGTDALSMLLLEFVPLVANMVGTVPRALMGWSVGGYGALRAAERAASLFVGVASASPALWLSPADTAPGAFDGPADFYANDVFRGINALSAMTVAVACGIGDPFYSATRDLAAAMPFPHQVFFGPGYHDVAYWRSVAPAQLQALRPVFT